MITLAVALGVTSASSAIIHRPWVQEKPYKYPVAKYSVIP